MERVRARVLVSGRVQGVYFRASTCEEATTLGVDGWVRNLPDGRVEAVFEGSRGRVERALAWTRVGPARADVRAVEVAWEPPLGERGFEVR